MLLHQIYIMMDRLSPDDKSLFLFKKIGETLWDIISGISLFIITINSVKFIL